MDSTASKSLGPDAQFQEALERGEFLLQHCTTCNSAVFYPRLICPSCGSKTLSWHKARGTGIVYSTTTIMRSAAQGGPYNVSIVELDEGPRLMTRVEANGGEVGIDARVRAAIEIEDSRHVLVFKMEDGS